MPLVGLVAVSHSRALADAAVALAAEMLGGADVRVEIAAGVDGGFGTDATAVLDAVTAADAGAGVVVLMDLGSAVLSAELALELLDDDRRERVLLTPAPFVEGLVAAAVAAAGGADRAAVAAEAAAGLAGKQGHLTPADAGGAAEGPHFAVVDPHGLHARPAARLVHTAAAFSARVELRNATTGSGWVAATSPTQVAGLGALQGHLVEVRAEGPDAEQAVRAVVVRGGGGWPAVAASPGTALGPARVLAVSPLPAGPPGGDPEQERARLERARDEVRAAIGRTRDAAATIGPDEAAVFDAHLLMLDDSDLVGDAQARLSSGAGAAAAWGASVRRVEALLAGLDNPYLRARAADVRAVGDAVLRRLLDLPEPTADVDGVLVAEDLTPAQVVELDPARTPGVVLAAGDASSHTAVLLRARGVPAVVRAGAEVLELADGTPLGVDGTAGELLVEPDEQALARLRAATAAGPPASR